MKKIGQGYATHAYTTLPAKDSRAAIHNNSPNRAAARDFCSSLHASAWTPDRVMRQNLN